MQKYKVTFSAPAKNHQKDAAGCYCVFDNKILILQRHSSKFEGGTWGVPGGKIELFETAKQACIREVLEEVGIDIPEDQLKEIGVMCVEREDISYAFYLFAYCFGHMPEVILELSEHVEYGWFSYEEAKKLPLIPSGLEALEFFYQKGLIV